MVHIKYFLVVETTQIRMLYHRSMAERLTRVPRVREVWSSTRELQHLRKQKRSQRGGEGHSPPLTRRKKRGKRAFSAPAQKLQKVAFMHKHFKRQRFTQAIYLHIMPNICKHYSWLKASPVM